MGSNLQNPNPHEHNINSTAMFSQLLVVIVIVDKRREWMVFKEKQLKKLRKFDILMNDSIK